MMSDGNSLLMAIHANPRELTPQLLYRDWAKENPEAIEVLIRSAMTVYDLLTADGIGISVLGRPDGIPSIQWEELRHVRWQRAKEELMGEHDSFAASMAWLATRDKRKTPDESSCHYKHEVERFWQDTHWSIYVPNGAFIAALICSEFEFRRDGMSVNVLCGISRKRLYRPPNEGERRATSAPPYPTATGGH